MKRIIIGIVVVLLMGGCATATKKQETQVQHLKHHVALLEAELDRRDREINRLEDELARREARVSSERRESKTVAGSAGFPPLIREVQAALKNAGFYRGSIDGKMGPKTKAAVISFQKTNGLKADGVVGKKTWLKLSRYVR